MNKSIPSRWAIIIIIIIAIISGSYLFIKLKEFNSSTQISAPVAISKIKKIKPKNICSIHAYKGKAKIKVWKSQKDGAEVLIINNADLAKLPTNAITYFKLIDASKKLEQKLATTSKKNPVTILITGLLSRCHNQIPLACLKYKKNIFHSYL